MKIRITHMKAPWTEGAKVGDVLKVDAIPAWAAGKCVQVDDGEKVTLEYEPPQAPDVTESPSGDLIKQLAEANAALAQRDETIADLRAGMLEIDARIAAADKARDEALEKLAAAEKQLAEAKPAEGKKAK